MTSKTQRLISFPGTRLLFFWFSVIFILLILFKPAFAAIDVKTYIPVKAPVLLPVVKSELQLVFPDIPNKEYVGGLVEQESCISLKHSKCWSPVSELNTDRELGIGLFQITKAYRKNGTIRFDTLSDLRRKYPKELADLSWDTVKTRPDLQIRSGILLIRDNYQSLWGVVDPIQRLQMSDSAYNGGLGNVKKARSACGMTRGCNPNVWFNHVENFLPQSRVAIYGHRSPYDINREHVRYIFELRMNKYKPYLN